MSLAPQSLTDLYEHEYGRLVGLLTVIGRDATDAEEVAQDAFVRLLEHWDKVRSYEDPAAWLRTVAVRLLLSRRRRRKVALRRTHLLGDGEPIPHASPDARLDLERAFGQLSASHRAVVVLHHLYDLPVEEVASHLRVPAGTVKSRLARARTVLGPLLSETSEREAI